ncbi:MAG TPA: hypothetical protein VJ549_00510 [Geothrix sp.]|nr:hypothetical protein [Geothrix sp.]HJV47729.1 hypothetical protein [Geothrix sp.]
MTQRIDILNGDDRPHALKTLKRAIKSAKGAARTHLAAVLRSLNPDAARSRAFKGASSMAKSTKKAAHHKTAAKHHPKKHNPTAGTTYTLHSVGTKAKAKVASAARRAAGNFRGLDVLGILKDGAGIGLGIVGTDIVAKQVVERFLPSGLPTVAKSLVATVGVGGLAIAIGGGKGFTREVAKGSVASFLVSLAKQYLPAGIMAGTDEQVLTGRWDANGQWIPDGGMSGVVYDPAYSIPDALDRPAYL